MNKHPCAAHGCASLAVGFSTLCSRHRKTFTRHGHHEQSPVTVHELAPYVRKVAARQKANPESPAWSILAERWQRIEVWAQHVLQKYAEGHASVLRDVQAAQQVQNLAGTVGPQLVIQTALAVYMLAEADPRRFCSDRAFDFQLVRRVRGLTATNAGSYWDHKTRKTKRVYRDLAPRAVLSLAAHLKTAFGAPGIQLARMEQDRALAAREEQERLADALEALQ
ncbi:hypothetical protein [Methylibium sp.]|jgi:hypothetical protein|uniref:hypothetical protein n=1 Tax=Methylibium sp. TaxID=2067992 RepID=UPI003D0D9283